MIIRSNYRENIARRSCNLQVNLRIERTNSFEFLQN